MIYLDNAATTKVTPEVAEAMKPYLFDNYANPSAQYSIARQARLAIEKARKQVADAINAEPNQIFFTSGATESNNIVMRAFDHTICSNIEHPSVKGIEFDFFEGIKDDHKGAFKLNTEKWCDSLQELITVLTTEKPKEKTILSCQMVNNETGQILPIKDMCDLAHKNHIPFHTDATQAFGHLTIDVKFLDCDFLSLSGHKFHAPKGIGVLYIKEPDKFKSSVIGGGQEKGIRSGTENVAGIVGIGRAAELFKHDYFEYRYVNVLYNYLIDLLRQIFPFKHRLIRYSALYEYIPNIVNIAIEGVEGESLLLLLDNKDICVSGGSACHSAQNSKSKVLQAMGETDTAEMGTIRVSMDVLNNKNDIFEFVKTLSEVVKAIAR